MSIFADGVSKKISKDVKKYLPSISRQLEDFRLFKERMELKEKYDKIEKDKLEI